MAEILIIDDEEAICSLLLRLAERMGHHAAEAHTLADGLSRARSEDYDIILLDLDLPDGNGLHILPDLLRTPAMPEVIIITGAGDNRGAELAFKHGAWDYVPKPFKFDEVSLPITRALQYRQEKKTVKVPLTLDRAGIIGSSPAIRGCLEDVARASVSEAGVLVSGETGTGKELFARAIHLNSSRSDRSFVVVDCGALAENLAESILFGHEKGAFTGAHRHSAGLIKQAEGGTLFFDEIGELPRSIQKSLLRVLQEKRFRPVGADAEVSVNFRLIAATNRDLDQMVADGRFRGDLLFRIRGIKIDLPPLRERLEDVEEIVLGKIRHLSDYYGTETKGVSREFFDALKARQWPGNVRELINVLEYSLASAGQDPTLYPKHLHPQYRAELLNIEDSPQAESAPDLPEFDEAFPSMTDYRHEAENRYLRALLAKTGGDRKEACRMSGVSQSRLYDLLKKHGLSFTNG